MKYALENLMQVKQLREEAAERQLAGRKQEQKQAEKALSDAWTRLSDFRTYRKEKEAAMFEAVKGKRIGFRELDEFKMGERLLAEKESRLAEEIGEYEKALEAARRKTAGALAEYQRKTRDNRKLKEHKKMVLEGMAAEEGRKSEMEIEELYRAPGR